MAPDAYDFLVKFLPGLYFGGPAVVFVVIILTLVVVVMGGLYWILKVVYSR